MTRTRTIVPLPVLLILAVAGMALFLMLRAQPVLSPAHFTGGPPAVSAPGATVDQPSGVQPNGSGAHSGSVVSRTGTSQGVSAPARQPAAAPVNVNPAGPVNNTNPCARTGKPAPMCPIAAP